MILRFSMVLACLAMILGAGALTVPARAAGGCSGGNAGAVLGGILGAFGGRAVAGKGNRTLGTFMGAAGGAVLGGAIGRSLDKCEREKLTSATETSLNGPERRTSRETWVSPTRPNVSGTVISAPATMQDDGRVCRSVTRVNYIDGQEMQDSPTFCRVPPSTAWTQNT